LTEERRKRVAIIASHGTLDMAYPPLLIATGAVAMDMEASIFFTFYGLQILKKGGADNLQVAPLANPALPMPVPNILGVLPGMTALATTMMKSMFKSSHAASLGELLDLARELGVHLVACQMTMDALGIKKEELIDGLEFGGVATLLDFCSRDAITFAF
jgi:peroxiredoxin family protein